MNKSIRTNVSEPHLLPDRQGGLRTAETCFYLHPKAIAVQTLGVVLHFHCKYITNITIIINIPSGNFHL